jgi:hypothetical protein
LPEQACPGVHEPQNPFPSHTWLDPHAVPGATLAAPSTQVAAPVAQETIPTLHGDGLPLHALPPAHATQVPVPLQTMLLPQAVPAALAAPSTQVCAPVAQDVTPFVHAAPGFVAHGWPGAHSPHCPFALQTWLAPQAVPAALGAPSTHACTPVAHDVTPFAHGFGLPVQDSPAVHVPHVPLPSQTLFVPQGVPADRLPKSRQIGPPF